MQKDATGTEVRNKRDAVDPRGEWIGYETVSAHFFGGEVPANSLRTMFAAGKIPAASIKPGKKRLFRRSDIETWIASMTEPAA